MDLRKKVFYIFIGIFLVSVLNAGKVRDSYEEGHKAFLNEKWEEAIIAYTEYLKIASENEKVIYAHIELSKAYFNLAQQHYNQGKYETARKLYYCSNTNKGDTLVSKCVCKIADEHFKLGRFEKSLELYRSVSSHSWVVAESKSGETKCILAIGDRLYAEGNYVKACSLYSLVSDLEGKERLNKSLFMYANNNENWKKCEFSDTTIKHFNYKLKNKEAITKDIIEAFFVMLKVEKDAQNLLAKANSHSTQGKYEKALELCEELQEKYKETEAGKIAEQDELNMKEILYNKHYLMGVAYKSKNEHQEAINEFEKALEYKDTDEAKKEARDVLYSEHCSIGFNYESKGEYQEAINEFEKALEYKDTNEANYPQYQEMIKENIKKLEEKIQLAQRYQILNSMRGKSLSSLTSFGLTPVEIYQLETVLLNMEPSFGTGALMFFLDRVGGGLGLIDEFNNLTLYQKFYVILWFIDNEVSRLYGGSSQYAREKVLNDKLCITRIVGRYGGQDIKEETHLEPYLIKKLASISSEKLK